MSGRSRSADVIAVGFDGTTLPDELTHFIERSAPAAFVLFGRNATALHQMRNLTDELRSHYPDLPPVIAIDQEGGRVARLREGVEAIPSMMAIAAAGDEDLAARAGSQVGFDLRRAGVNLDFAPVLDLALERRNTVIGTRSFGDDPASVTKFASAFASGLQSSGVIATLKHFPGHGSTAADSHFELPAIELERASLDARDLAPFAALLPKAHAVMTAHVVLRAIDEQSPATTAHGVLTDLLRLKLKFAGACFTDCMQMEAIAATVGTQAGAVAALAAGADCIVVSRSSSVAAEVAAAVDRALEDGTLAMERFEQACSRMRSLRGMLAAPASIDAASPHGGIGREIARRSITRVCGDWRADPSASIVVSFGGGASGAEEANRVSLSQFAPSLRDVRLELDADAERVEQMLSAVQSAQRLPIVLTQRAHLYDSQAGAVERLLRVRPDAVIVSTREPFDVECFNGARNVLAAYGDDAATLAGLADVLFGGFEPRGRLPVAL